MRSCEDMELLINLCLDDMLPSEEMASLQNHLKDCPVCRQRFAQLREMKAALADMEEPVPADLHQRIMAYVAENTEETAVKENAHAKILRPRRWYRALATVAACAVIAVAASRFVPNVKQDTAEILTAAPQAPGIAFEATTSEPEIDTNQSILTDMPAAQPSVSAKPEAGNLPQMPTEPIMTDNQTGQMAEDLPPLRQETDGDAKNSEDNILKWLKVQGAKEKLPQWVDAEFIYETELDGETAAYVEIADWAEEYWTDQLRACGFTVEEMDGQDLTADGEYILLFFFWTE